MHKLDQMDARDSNWLGVNRRIKVIRHLFLNFIRHLVNFLELSLLKVWVLGESECDGVFSDIVSVCNVKVG